MQLVGTLKDALSQHPLLIVFDVVALMTAVGCLCVLLREAVLFRGYRSLKRIAKSISSSLQGSIFRDGGDLVISGFYRGLPAVVRFSFAENTPEVNLWMKVISAMNLFVSHKSSKLTEGRLRIPTRDAWFDERFTIRTDHANDAVALISDGKAFSELKKLCCSPGTSIALTRDSLEMSELTIPQSETLKHLTSHMESLSELATRVSGISNLNKARTKIYVPDRYLLARTALIALAIAGALEVYSAARHYASDQAATSNVASASPAALPPEDETLLPALTDWRLAAQDDFDPTTVALMHEHKKDLSGRIVGNFNGQAPGTAYVFVRKYAAGQAPWRIATVSQGRSELDATFTGVVAVMLVPKTKLEASARRVPEQAHAAPPDGDGLMMIRRTNESESATIFYLSGGKPQTLSPTDYWSILTRD
jgi:hypothetical protein